MRKSKIISLLLCVIMIIATASTAFALAVPVAESENPTFYVEVTTVTAAGKAKVEIKFSVDSTFRAYEPLEDPDTLETVYVGKGIRNMQLEVYLNENLFDTSTLKSTYTGYKNKTATVEADKKIKWFNTATDDTGWMTDETAFTIVSIVADIKDAEIKALAATNTVAAKDALNAKTDLITYNSALVNIASYPVAGSAAYGEKDGWEYDTAYYNDGTGDYVPILKTGADAPAGPTAPEVDNTKIDKSQTVEVNNEQVPVHIWKNVTVYQNDLKANSFKAILTNVTENNDTQEVALSWAEGLFDTVLGGGKASFNVIVKVSEAHKTDNIQLKIVTDTLNSDKTN